MSRKRLISVMGLALVSLLAMNAPAQATGVDDSFGAATCVLQGVAGSAAGPGEDGVNNVLQDLGGDDSWDPLELLDTDPGSFTFDGDVTCAGVDIASEIGSNPEVVGPVAAHVTASGKFNNLICGTGTANGQATLTSDAIKATVNTNFGITFVGGVGYLSIVVNEDAPGNINNDAVSGGNGNGVIHIAPSVGNCVTTKVSEFLVDGAFATTLSGEGSDAVSNSKDSNS